MGRPSSHFAFSDGGGHLTMHKYVPESSKRKGADLVVRDLATGADVLFGDIAEFAWQNEGGLLAMTIDAEVRPRNGVQRAR